MPKSLADYGWTRAVQEQYPRAILTPLANDSDAGDIMAACWCGYRWECALDLGDFELSPCGHIFVERTYPTPYGYTVLSEPPEEAE